MKQKALLYAVCAFHAIAVPFLTPGAAAAADAPLIEKQFALIDSSLTRLAGRPEARMKEVAPFDAVAKQVLAEHPEIAAVLRTNSKGTVVNCMRRANGESMLHADVSGQQWYAAAKSEIAPYYSPLRKENGRAYCIWSRPLSIAMPIGGSRFGGVVAVSLDVTVCFNRFAAAMRGPFQIMLDGKSFYYLSWKEGQPFDETPLNLPGNLHFSLRLHKSNETVTTGIPAHGAEVPEQRGAARVSGAKVPVKKAPPGRDAFGNQELPAGSENSSMELPAVPDTVPDAVSGRKSGSSLPGFIRIAGIVAVLLVIFCLWLIISTLRRRQPARISANAVPASLLPGQDDRPAGPSLDIVKTEEEMPLEAVPSYADIPPLSPPVSGTAVGEPPADAPEPQQNEMPPVAAFEPSAPAFDVGPPPFQVEPLEKETTDAAARQVHEEILAEMREEARAKITDDQRNEIYKREIETMASAIRQQIIDREMAGLIETLRKQFTEEMHQHITETMSASIEEQERSNVAKEAAERIRAGEYDAIVRAEREKLSQSVRTKLAEEESARLTAEAQEKLKNEITKAVHDNEEDVVRARVREDMAGQIRQELLEKERDAIAGQQLQKVETELYSEVSRQQRDAIRESVMAKITDEEHQRVDAGLRRTIVENERKRIIAEESEGMREQIRTQLRQQEIESMRRDVRDEIYSETVQAIKQNLEERYQAVVGEKIADLRVALHKKIRADISGSIKADYEQLMEHIDRLSTSLTNIEALQSLSQTVTLLTDEKKKYKYLNLNTAQTESLLEYLRRVHNRFNIFFDQVDESVRELMLKLGSVKNKLDENE